MCFAAQKKFEMWNCEKFNNSLRKISNLKSNTLLVSYFIVVTTLFVLNKASWSLFYQKCRSDSVSAILTNETFHWIDRMQRVFMKKNNWNMQRFWKFFRWA